MSSGSSQPVLRLFWQGTTRDGWREPRRRIYDCELVYVSKGAFSLSLKDSQVTMRNGSIALIPPAFWHESQVAPGAAVTRHCIHFDWNDRFLERRAPLAALEGEPFDRSLVHSVPGELTGRLPLVSHAPATDPIIDIVKLCARRAADRDPTAGLLLWPILMFLVERNDPQANPVHRIGKTQQAMFALKHFIDTNYDQPINYEDFRRLVGSSPAHLCQSFSRIVGQPPTAYLNDLRLHHARELLSEPGLNVGEVSLRVGFADSNYFTRLFRRKFGVPPSRFTSRRRRDSVRDGKFNS